MASPFYSAGTLSLDFSEGERLVTGTGTAWVTAGIQQGDMLKVGNYTALIDSVSAQGELVLAEDWPSGEDIENAEYKILLISPLRVTNFELADEIRTLLRHLGILKATSKIITVQAFGLTAPTGSETSGDLVVVAGSGATGAFAGRENAVLLKDGTAWEDIYSDVIAPGWIAYVEGTGDVYTWDGSSWSRIVGIGVGINFIPGGWNSGEQYIAGDVIVHNRVVWAATQEHSNEEPATGSDYWEVFSRYPDFGGAMSFPMKFDDSTVNSQPATGYLRLNNAGGTQRQSTSIISSLNSIFGISVNAFWNEAASSTNPVKGEVRIHKDGRPDVYLVFKISAVSTPDNNRKVVTVENISYSANNPFTDEDDLVVHCSRVADKGDQGLASTVPGPRGPFGGAAAIPYTFSTTTSDSDPGNGIVRLGSATQNASAVLRADLFNNAASDVTGVLDSLATASTSAIKASGRLVHRDTPDSKFIAFDITALATPVGYRNISIVVTGSSESNPFANNDPVYLLWAPKGDRGDSFLTGTGAPSDLQGRDGDIYIRSNGSVYQKVGGTWGSPILNITGPQGATGAGLYYDHIVADITERNAGSWTIGDKIAVRNIGDGTGEIYELLSNGPQVWSVGLKTTGGAYSIVVEERDESGDITSADDGRFLLCTTQAVLVLDPANDLADNFSVLVKAADGPSSIATSNGELFDNGLEQIDLLEGQTAHIVRNSAGFAVILSGVSGGRVENITGNRTLYAEDNGKTFLVTSGSPTISFAPAAELGNGWYCWIKNAGGTGTLDPNSSEQIDGSLTVTVGAGRRVACTGTAFRTLRLMPESGSLGIVEADIGAGAVTAGKIGTDAVETAKIKDKNVTLAKIEDFSEGEILGRENGSGTGVPQRLVGAQLRAILSSREKLTSNRTIYVGYDLGSCTITNATPAVVTKAGHGLAANTLVVFTTTGALPTGLGRGNAYYVKNPTTDTFEVSSSPGGSSIATSSAGSGTHYVRTGNDSNSGLTNSPAAALHTVQEAINRAYALDVPLGTQIKIKLARGFYWGGGVAGGPLPGGGELVIEGDNTTPSNCNIKADNANCFAFLNGCVATVQGFKLETSTAGNAILAKNCCSISVGNMEYGPCVGDHNWIEGCSVLTESDNAIHTISGGCVQHHHIVNGSQLISGADVTITGSPTMTRYLGLSFARAEYTSAASFTGSLGAGTKTMSHNMGALNTNGKTLPGSGIDLFGGNVDDVIGADKLVSPSVYLNIDNVDGNGAVIYYNSGTGHTHFVPRSGYALRFGGHFIPETDGGSDIANATFRLNGIYLVNNPIVTSDARVKKIRGSLADLELLAWSKVRAKAYQLLDAIARKGEDHARIHFGWIAQEVFDAFEEVGLDPMVYGPCCVDEITESQTVDGEPREVGTGEFRYGLRYEECFVLETTLGRRRTERLMEIVGLTDETLFGT